MVGERPGNWKSGRGRQVKAHLTMTAVGCINHSYGLETLLSYLFICIQFIYPEDLLVNFQLSTSLTTIVISVCVGKTKARFYFSLMLVKKSVKYFNWYIYFSKCHWWKPPNTLLLSDYLSIMIYVYLSCSQNAFK